MEVAEGEKEAKATPPLNGRVLRVHFHCRAELPMGTSLWVTSSLHPTETVEMVTCPDTYPLWRTLNPVVVVATEAALLPDAPDKMKHRYRYVAKTPGAEIGLDENDDPQYPEELWEDPLFHNNNSNNNDDDATSDDLRKIPEDLPYRTLFLPVQDSTVSSTVTDVWNDRTDVTWRGCLGTNDEPSADANKASTTRVPYESSTDEEFSDYDAEIHIKNATVVNSTVYKEKKDPQTSKKLYMVCFHLPVTLRYDSTAQTWSASWNESLLAGGMEGCANYDVHYVGTVGIPSNFQGEVLPEEDIRTVLLEKNCTPLFLNQAVVDAHYLGFCKQVLWPSFMNVGLLDLSASGWGQSDVVTGETNGNSNFTSDWDQSRLDKWWEAYNTVNRVFAESLTELMTKTSTSQIPSGQSADSGIRTPITRDTIVWVHDYHLLLLPQLLDEQASPSSSGTSEGRAFRIIFFLHIPFPTSQIFRELECGVAVLNGMLHADVLGFHAFDHARHFLNACRRILGLNHGSIGGTGLIGVQTAPPGDRTVLVTMSNVSIEPGTIDECVTEVNNELGETNDRILLAGVDICQRLSGVAVKLLAYERLLTDYPNWKDKLTLVQHCLLPGSRQADEVATLREVRFLVRRIQERFGRSVVDCREHHGASGLPQQERIKLWLSADVMVHTPVREGLNLLPMEYMYTRSRQQQLFPEKAPGVLIASEFSVVCSVMNGALRVNPFDLQLTATHIDTALTMESRQKDERAARDFDFLTGNSRERWISHVLREAAHTEGATIAAANNNNNDGSVSKTAHNKNDNNYDPPTVNPDEVAAAYSSCTTGSRMIVLDFNGTITLREPPGKYLKSDVQGGGTRPPTHVLQALEKLAANPRNRVFVVSGDSKENLEAVLGHVPGLTLAASNGGCYRYLPKPSDNYDPSLSSSLAEWNMVDLGVLDWEAVVTTALPLLSKYTARTNGSYVKLTYLSIGWSYYSCDPEWGAIQAAHLVEELQAELQAFDVRFVTLVGVLEIVPRRIHKGLFVKRLLFEHEGPPPEFILCVGDDVSDEPMFRSVLAYASEVAESTVTPPPTYCYTVTVGNQSKGGSGYHTNNQQQQPSQEQQQRSTKGGEQNQHQQNQIHSHAKFRVDSARDVASILMAMNEPDDFRRRSERAMSWDNLDTTGWDFFA